MKIRPVADIVYYALRIMAWRDRREHGLEAVNKSSVKNILIVSSTAIGDTLLSTPAIRAVRFAYPKARIIALFNKSNMELFKNNPHIDGVVPYCGGWKKFISTVSELKKYSFDIALILHGNEPQITPLCYLAGPRFIVKLPNASRFNFLLSNQTPVLTWADLGHGIEARLETAALIGCQAQGLQMELPLDKCYDAPLKTFMERENLGADKVLVGLNPGASTLSRQWFPERFTALAESIQKARPEVRFVLTGSPEEAALCRKIAENINTGNKKSKGVKMAVIAAGRLSLPESAALIGKLSAFVTGDTGPMHIAYALNTPTVALYAVSEPTKTGPLTDTGLHRIIKKPKTCHPCLSKKCTYQECMEQISVEEVYSALMDILSVKKAAEKNVIKT